MPTSEAQSTSDKRSRRSSQQPEPSQKIHMGLVLSATFNASQGLGDREEGELILVGN